MINNLLPIIGIIVAAFIVFKFFGSILKGILPLALVCRRNYGLLIYVSWNAFA